MSHAQPVRFARPFYSFRLFPDFFLPQWRSGAVTQRNPLFYSMLKPWSLGRVEDPGLFGVIVFLMKVAERYRNFSHSKL